MIQTGTGTEYCLTTPPRDIGVDATVYELPPSVIPPEILAVLREHPRQLKLNRNRFELLVAIGPT
jgi:hypothetical protein